MPADRQPALEEDGVVAEGGEGLSTSARHRVFEVGRVVDDSHPFATAACRRFDEKREADLFCRRRDFGIGIQLDRRQRRHLGLLHQPAWR